MDLISLGTVTTRWANVALRPLNLRLQQQPQWDRQFKHWIRQRDDVDPNDTGDSEWATDLLDEGLEQHYLRLLSPEAVIVELGPGSGRLSRHLIGHCKELVVVDDSPYVCKWMHKYLAGKGRFQVHRINGPLLPMLGDATVDAVVAHGVFEHLDLDESFWFLVEFARILRRGGGCSFNFDTVATPDGIAALREFGGPGWRSVFRLHHPESIRCVAQAAGFEAVDIKETSTRIAFADLIR
jgi:SAM-dependent methyltransferase